MFTSSKEELFLLTYYREQDYIPVIVFTIADLILRTPSICFQLLLVLLSLFLLLIINTQNNNREFKGAINLLLPYKICCTIQSDF